MAESEALKKDNNKYRVKMSALAESSLNEILLQQIGEPGEAEYLILPENPPVITQDDELLLPIKTELNDGSQKLSFLPFEDYFKLLSKIWDLPDHGKNAELITMDRKMQDAAPYNVFFNSLKHCPETKDQLYSVSFTDLLCPSLGKLKCSFHLTFMAQIWWILAEYASRKLHKLPMTIIHGYENFPWPDDKTMKTLYPDIEVHHVKKDVDSLGCHHTKLSIFMYEDDSMRLVIGSANLYAEDWSIYNQQLWISPRCPKLPEGCSMFEGESPTGFKLALLDYLLAYEEMNISSLDSWVRRIQSADFREIKVALLYSVPGAYLPRKNGCFFHYLGHLLSKDCTIPAPKKEHNMWRVVAQTASLGLVGKTPEDWLTTNLLKSLTSHKDSPYLPSFALNSKVEFNLIYPTVQNTLNAYLGIKSAACCGYEKSVKELQPWLLQYKCQWKADRTKRTRAIAHSKCYCRISPCWQKMAYFFLTSANLSRSGWGSRPNPDCSIFVRSFEIGVLFLPKYFGEEYFEVREGPERKNTRLFPLMFDLPLTPYAPDDDSYCVEDMLAKLQINGSNDEESGDWVNVGIRKASGSKQVDKPADQRKMVQKKDMKYSGRPPSDSFFPSFKKDGPCSDV